MICFTGLVHIFVMYRLVQFFWTFNIFSPPNLLRTSLASFVLFPLIFSRYWNRVVAPRNVSNLFGVLLSFVNFAISQFPAVNSCFPVSLSLMYSRPSILLRILELENRIHRQDLFEPLLLVFWPDLIFRFGWCFGSWNTQSYFWVLDYFWFLIWIRISPVHCVLS